MSRTRAPGLSSVPTPSAPATSATIGQPGKDMSAAHGGRERHRRRLRPRPGPPQRGPGRSRLDGPATRHLRSVGSAHLVGARRRRLSPGGMRGPRRIVCGVAARCPRPARSPQQLGRLGRGETPHVAQRQRRQQLDRLRLGDRHERGRVRTVRVRRADCRRSPRATRAFLRIPAPIPAANRGRTLRRDPTSAIAGGTRDQAAPVVDGVDREQQQRQVHAVRDASAAGQPAAIGSRHPVTAPAKSDPSDRSPRSDRRPLDIDAGLPQRAGLDARCRAPPPTIVYPAWAQVR